MLGFRSAAVATLWVSLSAATPGVLAAQAQSDADPRTPRFLLAVAGARKPIDVQRTPALSRHIALDFNGQTLAEALAIITQRSGLRLAYTEDVLPRDARVQLRASEISVAGALSTVLLDAGVDVVFTSGSQASLVRRVAVAPPAVGSIVGRVTEAKTGQGIEGVEVLLEGTRWRTLTAADGQFRLSEVDTGAYVVIVRRIGYTRQNRSVRVVEGQEATADFELQAAVTKLNELVTTGTVVPTEVKAVPTPISVITAEDIALQRPTNLQQLFRQAVPTAVSWDQPASPYVTAFAVRGASTLSPGGGQMKVFIDGVEAALPSRSPVDISSIERIEVIRGPQAATIYGSDATGGVIQVFTKRDGGASSGPRVTAEGSLGLLRTPYEGHTNVVRQSYSASLRGGNTGLGYNVGAGYTRTGDYIPRGEISDQSTPSVYGGLRMTQRTVALDLSGRYHTSNAPSVFNPELFESGFASFSQPNFLPSRLENQSLGARLSVTPTAWWQNSLALGISRLQNELVQSRPRLTSPADTLLLVFHSTQAKKWVGYHTAVQSPLSSKLVGSLTVGFDHYDFPINQYVTAGALNTSGSISTAPGSGVSASRTNTRNTGYFAQAQVGISDALFLTGGLRAERNSNFGDSLGTPISPRAGMSLVRPVGAATLKLRGSYGKAIRAPAPGSKLAATAGTAITLSNPNLSPERQAGWDFGGDLSLSSGASLSLTYYTQVADDMVEYVLVDPSSAPPTFQFQNVGRVKNVGLEIEGDAHVGPLHLKAQYGYARSRVERLPPNYVGDLRVGDQAWLTPEHTAGASITTSPLPATTVALGMTYVGTWNYYDILAQFRCFGGTGPCAATSRDYIIKYPGFVKLNASGSQKLSPSLSAFLTVDNVTNNRAHEFFNFNPVIGRTVTFGLRLES